jgi:hypothetical protein
MREVQTSLIINAPRRRVWETFLDKSRWAAYSDLQDLDPSLPIAEGRTFRFRLNLLGFIPVPFTVRVTRRAEAEELRWVGKGPGARGEHYFRFSDAGKNQTRLVHGEEWSGPLGELVHLLLSRVIAETFAAFNVGLALQVEKQE